MSCVLARRSSKANSLCGPEFGWISGNPCELSKEYFATTFLSSSPTTSATHSGLRRLEFKTASYDIEHRTAAKAGIMANDIITHLDEVPVQALTLN
jgi:hypothetical protein